MTENLLLTELSKNATVCTDKTDSRAEQMTQFLDEILDYEAETEDAMLVWWADREIRNEFWKNYWTENAKIRGSEYDREDVSRAMTECENEVQCRHSGIGQGRFRT